MTTAEPKQIVPHTWTAQFEGYWPVGAVAVIYADTKEQARDLLEQKLKEMKLPQSISLDQMNEVEVGVTIFLDGDY